MLFKRRRLPTRKRSFLLFELVLAIGLVLLCLFPMIKTHLGIARAERKQMNALNREKEICSALCRLKMDLHQHTYSWEALMKGVNTQTYSLKKEKQSTKKKNGESGMVLCATLHFENEEIERLVYVEKALLHTH